eukprot:scaffold27510_cov18-Tisochrysis_lutea.AAC.4
MLEKVMRTDQLQLLAERAQHPSQLHQGQRSPNDLSSTQKAACLSFGRLCNELGRQVFNDGLCKHCHTFMYNGASK